MDIELDLTLRYFRIARNLPQGQYRLGEIFKGLENSPPIHKIFTNDQDILNLTNLDVELTTAVKYMRVLDGRLLVGPNYIRRGRREFIYLDLIHELTHVRQYREGLDI